MYYPSSLRSLVQGMNEIQNVTIFTLQEKDESQERWCDFPETTKKNLKSRVLNSAWPDLGFLLSNTG